MEPAVINKAQTNPRPTATAHAPRHRPRRLLPRLLGLTLALCVGFAAATARAQNVNPVYLDDAPVATEALARVNDHLASGNLEEAARVLQMVLDEHAERVTPPPTKPGEAPNADLGVCVRTRVIETLLNNPALLKVYRGRESAEAQHRLELGDEAGVERSRLLTPAGLEAALRLAQRQIEDARFETARLTLDELDKHPDRAGAPGRDAARLMTLLSRYLPREEIKHRAALWQTQAGMTVEEVEAIAWPEAATSRGVSPLRELPTPPASLQGIVSQPLWSVVLSEPQNQGPADPRMRMMLGAEEDPTNRTPAMARKLFALPTVADELVLVNDGLNISAWDRYTLAPRWAIPLPMPAANPEDENDPNRFANVFGRWDGGSGDRLEDATTVTVRGPWGAAVGGQAVAGVRRGDSRVHFFRVDTGEPLWSVDLGELDPALAQYSVRGPVLIDEGLVVVAARRAAPDQRLLVSLALVALDARDGSLVWSRTVASAGFPFFRQSIDVHAMTVRRGVVYRVDQLGVVGAYELGTGRPVWVRKMPVEAVPMGIAAQAWEVQSPLVDRESVVFLAPDHRRVVRLDAETGEVLGALPSDRLMSPPPNYLMAAGEDGKQLVAVGMDRVASVPIETFDKADAKVNLSPALASPGILGRVTTTGGALLVPTVSGVVITDAASPAKVLGHVDLDEPGNALALSGQIIVADDARLHTYLVWERVESQLTKRMEADPKDASAAVTYAELAYRAQRPAKIMPAVEKAIAAIDAEPTSDRNQLARRRLFEAVHEMLLASLERPAGGAETPSSPGIEDAATLARLTAALGRVAKSADERVAQLFAAGRLAEEGNRAAEAGAAIGAAGDAMAAVEVYQRVLDDDALAAATWRGERLAVRGDLEATRRIQQLIARHGAAVYDLQSRRASDELAVLANQPETDAGALTRIASRYPLAPAAARARLLAARLWSEQNKPQEMLTALTAGLAAAQRVEQPGAEGGGVEASVVGELAGRLVETYMSRGQYRSALRVLAMMRAAHPDVPLVGANEGVLDVAALRGKLGQRLAAVEHWPRVGPLALSAVQLIEDRAIVRPVIRPRTPRTAGAVALANETELSLWATSSLTKAEAAAGQKTGAPLEKIWSRPLGEVSANVVSVDESAAVLYYFDYTSGSRWLERVGFSPAEVVWKTKPFDDAVAETTGPGAGLGAAWGLRAVPGGGMRNGAGPGGDERFVLPSSGLTKSLDELMVCKDEGVVILVERSGKAAAYDTNSGELLWASGSLLSRVYDAALGSGRLVLGGVRRAGGGGVSERGGQGAGADKGTGFETSIVVVDARTGTIEQRLGEGLGPIHWLDIGEDGPTSAPGAWGGGWGGGGLLVVGHQGGIVCYDLATGRANWALGGGGTPRAAAAAADENEDADHAVGGPSFPAINAWTLGQTLVMLDAQQRLWAFAVATGPEEAMTPLDAPTRYFNDTEVNALILSAGDEAAGEDAAGGAAGTGGVAGGRSETFAITTRHGVLMYGPDNRLLGMDALAGTEAMLPPAPASDRFVALQTIASTRRADGLLTFAAHQFRAGSGRALDAAEIVLAARPTEVALLDGLVCLTSAGSTIVVPAPQEKRP